MRKNELAVLCKPCRKKLNKVEAKNKRIYRLNKKKEEDKLWEDFEKRHDLNTIDLSEFDKSK